MRTTAGTDRLTTSGVLGVLLPGVTWTAAIAGAGISERASVRHDAECRTNRLATMKPLRGCGRTRVARPADLDSTPASAVTTTGNAAGTAGARRQQGQVAGA